MKVSEITPDFFFNWLEEKGFKEGWEEGYQIDNENYHDDVSYEEFFKKIPTHLWLYHGPSITCAYYPKGEYVNDPDPVVVKFCDRIVAWRDKYRSLFADCDEEWMQLVWDCEDWEEYSRSLNSQQSEQESKCD